MLINPSFFIYFQQGKSLLTAQNAINKLLLFHYQQPVDKTNTG